MANFPRTTDYLHVSPSWDHQSPPAVNIIPPNDTNIVTHTERQISTSYPVSELSNDYIDYTFETNRLATFSRWPLNRNQDPCELARAGFYLIPRKGKLDRVKCAYCKGKLFDWAPHDDPWQEHKRCFPHCPYIKLCMGDDTSKQNQSASSFCSVHDDERPSTLPPLPEPPQGNMTTSASTEHADNLKHKMKSEAVEAILEMGYPKNLVRRVVKKCLKERPGNFPPTEELASMVIELDDPQPAVFAVVSPLTPLQRIMAAAASTKSQTSSGNKPDTGSSQNNRTIQDKHRPLATHPDSSQGSKETYSIPDHEDTLKSNMKSASVEAILEMGYSEDLVLRIVKKCLKERPRNFPPTEELASMVMELDDPQPAVFAVVSPLTPLQRMMAAAASIKSQTSSGNKPDTGSSRNSSRDKGDHLSIKRMKGCYVRYAWKSRSE